MLRKVESLRKNELETMNKKFDEVNVLNSEQKNRIDAIKIRNKNLCDEITTLKLQTIELLEKNQSNEKYIKSLNVKKIRK